jgi:hypothetical protein
MTRQLAVNMGACALLVVQYLLGMVVNVYVVLPGRHPGAGAGDYFSGAAAGLAWVVADGPAWAAAHAAFGMALAATALAAVALAWRRGGTGGRTASVIGALAIIGAGFNGASFVNYGHAVSSMIMAGLSALALACYLAGAILAYRPQSIASAKPQLALFSLIRRSSIARRRRGTLQTRLGRIIITAGVGAVALGAGLGGSLAVASAATSHAAPASSTTARTSSANSGNVAAATPAPSATHSTRNCPNMTHRPATG